MARIFVTFTGGTTRGPITVPHVKIGDQIVGIVFTTTPVGGEAALGQDARSSFSTLVFATNQIFQAVGSDYSGYTFAAILDRDVLI